MNRISRITSVAALSVVMALVAPATARADDADLGPVLGPLPAVGSGGGVGTPALNAAVATACGAGTLGNPRWFTLPADDAGDLLAEGMQYDDTWNGHGAAPAYPTSAAIVDEQSGAVLACPGRTAHVTSNRPLQVVVWIGAGDAEAYSAMIGGGAPPADVRVRRTSNAVPANDSSARAIAVTSLPFEYRGDTSLATWDGPQLPDQNPVSSVLPTFSHNVWFRWSAGFTGEIVTAVLSDDFTGAVGLVRPTPDGLVPVDPIRDGDGFPTGRFAVTGGADYLIEVAGYTDAYWDRSFAQSGYFRLYVGPTTAPRGDLGVRVAPNAQGASVTWTSDGAAGATTTTGFVVRAEPYGAPGSTTAQQLGASARSATITGLALDRRYRVTVSATSSAGVGAPQGVAVTVSVAVGPAPEGLEAIVDAVKGTAMLTWSSPTYGQAVTGFAVGRDGVDAHGAGPWSTTVSAATRSLIFTSLKAGSVYRLWVRATTAGGPGATAAVAVRVLAAPVPPTSPRQVVLTQNDRARSAEISWQPPESDGQAPVQYYDVELRALLPGGGSEGALVLASDRSHVFSILRDAIPYVVTVSALNAAGAGPTVARQVVAMNVAPPSQPTGLSATVGDGSALLRWKAPDYPGSWPVTGYGVTVFQGTTDTEVTGVHVDAPSTYVLISGLTNGSSYTFRVQASNYSSEFGAGSFGYPSARSDVFVPARPPAPVVTVPGAPTIGTATGTVVNGHVRAVARWAPPVSDGGSPVLAYRVYAFRMSSTGTVLSTTVSPRLMASYRAWTMVLPVVGRYRFAVRAANAVGYSTYSARSNLMSPARVPTAPRIAVATSGVPGGAVTATARWLAPVSTGGTVVTAYRVYAFRVSSSGVVLSYTMSPLLRSTTRAYSMTLPKYGWYRFAVRAVNAMGYSPFSAKAARVIGR